MRLRLLNVLTALSLLLCAAVCVVLVMRPNGVNMLLRNASFGWEHYGGLSVYVPGLGHVGLYEVHGYAGPSVHLSLPRPALAGIACVTAAVSFLGIFWGQQREAIKRRSAGRCVGCNYDLRATPDRCPECGAVPARFGYTPPMGETNARGANG